MKKKILAIILSAMLIVPILSVLPACADDNTPPLGEEMTFAVLSDIHLQVDDDEAEAKYRRAVNTCRDLAGDKGLSAICVAGDLVDTMWWDEGMYDEDGNKFSSKFNSAYGENQMKNLVRVIDDTVGDSAFLYCLGNHDMGWGRGQNKTADAAFKGYYDAFDASDVDYWKYDQPNVSEVYSANTTGKQMHYAGLRYAKVGRSHFITLSAQKYYTEDAAYDDIQLAWLDETLAYIQNNYKHDPVFLFTHTPIKNSVAESGSGTTTLNDIVIKYPQLVTFTGHIHASQYSEYAIDQELGFTCVEGSSVKYTGNDTGSDFTANLYYADSSVSSQGLLVTVKPDSEVVIQRIDFTTGKKAGEDWVIPAVGRADRHKALLDADRKANNECPNFPADGGIVSVAKKNGYLNVTFAPAVDEDSLIYGYSATVTYSSGDTKTLKCSADYGQPKETKTYCLSFELAELAEKVEVYAYDVYGAKSVGIVNMLNSFVDEDIAQPDSKLNVTQTLGDVSMNGYDIKAGTGFKLTDGVLNNKKSMRGCGNTYFNGFGTDYEFSYKIKNMQLNKASTMHGVVQEDYRVGATLATFPYNGRVYSICASLDFGYFQEKDADGNRNDKDKMRVDHNKLSYYLAVYSDGALAPSMVYELDGKGMPSVDLGATDYKSMLKSATGATLRVKREGNSFKIFLNDTLLDTKSIPASIYQSNGILVSFDENTVASFGIACLGAEADFTDITAVVTE